MVPCSAYFDKNSKFNSINYLLEKTIELETETKKYLIEPISVSKGTVLLIEIDGNTKLATANLNKMAYSHPDYSFDELDQSVAKLEDKNSKKIFLFNSIIKHGHYLDVIPILKSYPLYFTYFAKMKLSNSSINIETRLDIVNGKSKLNSI